MSQAQSEIIIILVLFKNLQENLINLQWPT